MEPSDDAPQAMAQALSVLRAWNRSGGGDDMTLALHEVEHIREQDGGTDQLLTGLINVAGFLLVNLEQRGQSADSTLRLVEAFIEARRAAE